MPQNVERAVHFVRETDGHARRRCLREPAPLATVASYQSVHLRDGLYRKYIIEIGSCMKVVRHSKFGDVLIDYVEV